MHLTWPGGIPAAALLLSTFHAHAATPAPDNLRSVIVLPVTALGDVPRDLALQVTSLVTEELGRIPRMRVVNFREVESILTAEQARQVSGCDTASCMAEIAGALNTEESVSGTLGVLGDEMLLTLSRIQARDARVLGRTAERFRPGNAALLVAAIKRASRSLYPEEQPAGGGSGAPVRRLGLGIPGAALVGAALGGLLVAAVAATVGLALVGMDVAGGGTLSSHSITRTQALVAHAASITGVLVLGVALLTAAGSAVLLGGAAWPG